MTKKIEAFVCEFCHRFVIDRSRAQHGAWECTAREARRGSM